MQSCQSFMGYVMQHAPHGPPPPGRPLGQAKTLINLLPGGLSCTETSSGGDLLSLYGNRTVLSAISFAAGIGSKNVSDKASAMPSIMSGIAGFLAGGMLVVAALSRYSK